MQMKSYHEWTLLCSVFTLDQLCSDHFHRLIHAKFLTTKRPISPPASRCWSLLKGLYFTAVVFSFFFRRLISEITEWISTKRGHIFTYDCYLKKIFPNPNSQSPHGLGAKCFLDWLRTLTENISAREHGINNRKETPQSTGIPLHGELWSTNGWERLVSFCNLHPLKFARRTSCRRTFATFRFNHIRQMAHIWSTQMPRAYLALVRLRAGRANAGLCHASSIVFMLCDFSLCSDECDILKRLRFLFGWKSYFYDTAVW